MSETTFATALDSLGQLLPADPGRDAIHLATHAATAAERLFPGQHIGIEEGKATTKAAKLIGIVDPFLPAGVNPGQMFWLVLYPRTITSLRHVWEHPDFPSQAIEAPLHVGQSESERWIADFAASMDQTVNRLMAAASLWEDTSPTSSWGGEYTMDNSESYKGIPQERWDEFWRHYEIVKGSPLDEGVRRESFFTCSC
jgi:hypothetical protein